MPTKENSLHSPDASDNNDNKEISESQFPLEGYVKHKVYYYHRNESGSKSDLEENESPKNK